jgi:hypothetical protein
MATELQTGLIKGITDASGFVSGTLGGLYAGKALGFDALAAGYGNATVVGILLCGLGGGLGLHLARWAFAKKLTADKKA